MSSVPLPVRLGWYAWRFAATTAEMQMRMTHAVILSLRDARPLAPAGWREVSKVNAAVPLAPAKPAPKATNQETDTSKTEASPPKPRASSAPVRSQINPKGKAATPARGRRIPSPPPPMPNGRLEG